MTATAQTIDVEYLDGTRATFRILPIDLVRFEERHNVPVHTATHYTHVLELAHLAGTRSGQVTDDFHAWAETIAAIERDLGDAKAAHVDPLPSAAQPTS